MDIDIFSDVACPWCWLGKRRLERAVAEYGGDVTLRWRAFQVDPDAPSEPRPLLQVLSEPFGNEQLARRAMAEVAAAAADDGITFDFENALSANTYEAHRLIWYAETQGVQSAVVEALHRAYFVEGRDVGSEDVLVDVAAGAGLDPTEVRAYLDSPGGLAEVDEQLATARDLGVFSAPTFVFAKRYAVSGAQDSATMLTVLREVARSETQNR